MKVVSREYKLLLDHREFRDRRVGLATFLEEVGRLARPARLEGDFGTPQKRSVVFLDTPDLTLRRLGLVLRSRISDDKSEITIKCRSEDRYFVAGTDLGSAPDLKDDEKLEEDISAPFLSRYSRSNTVAAPRPATWGDAAAIFPILASLRLDEQPLSPGLPLRVVNDFEVFERAYKGPVVHFEDRSRDNGIADASTSLVLWSDGKEGRPVVAEFSFRLKDEDEKYSRDLARDARAFFERLQRHDWIAPLGTTKTQFAFGDPPRN